MPDHPLPAPARTRTVVVGLAALVLLLAGLVAARPAAAHDALAGSDPADGASLGQAPAQVVLTFTADQLPVGAAVVVSDASGTDRADGVPVVAGRTVTQALEPGLPAGSYTVQWRSVSGDGHPVEGTLAFEVTVGAAEPATTPAAAGPDEASADAGRPADGADDVDAADDGAGDEGAVGGEGAGSAGGGLLPVGVGLAVAAAAVVAVALAARRRPVAPEEAR